MDLHWNKILPLHKGTIDIEHYIAECAAMFSLSQPPTQFVHLTSHLQVYTWNVIFCPGQQDEEPSDGNTWESQLECCEEGLSPDESFGGLGFVISWFSVVVWLGSDNITKYRGIDHKSTLWELWFRLNWHVKNWNSTNWDDYREMNPFLSEVTSDNTTQFKVTRMCLTQKTEGMAPGESPVDTYRLLSSSQNPFSVHPLAFGMDWIRCLS